MEFFIFVGLFVLITLLLPWINFFSIRRLSDDLDALRRQIARDTPETPGFQCVYHDTPHKEDSLWVERRRAAETTAEPLPPVLHEEPAFTPPPHTERPVAEIYQEDDIGPVEEAHPARAVSFEQNIGTKISVWLGAVALIFAAFYLVKYSIDQGFLSPAVRLSLSGLFGGGLISAGQWLCNREHIANAARIAQGLVGAGVVTLYVCLYAGLNLYALLSPGFAFAGMAAVTAIAVVMSLRHGQPIAIFGIVGGLLTPLMVGSDSPNMPLLFSYLFLLYAGIIFFLVRRGWWLLSTLFLGGVFLWPVFWLLTAFHLPDYRALVLFVSGVCAASLFATGSRTRSGEDAPFFHGFNTLSMLGAALIIFFIGFKVSLDLFDWSMLQLISLAVLVLVYFRIDQYRNILWAKLGLDIILFLSWSDKAPADDILFVSALMSAVYMVLPLWLMLRANAVFYASVKCVFAVAVSIAGYFQLNDRFADDMLWAAGALVLAAIFAALAHVASRLYRGYESRDFLLAVYTSSASFFISAGLALALPAHYLPLAFAGQGLATLLIYRKVGLPFLKIIAFALCCAFVALNWQYVSLFSLNILSSIVGSTSKGFSGALEYTEYKLFLPAFLTGAGYFLLPLESDRLTRNVREILLCLTGVLLLAYGYIFLRQFFHMGQIFKIEAGFIERGLVTLMFAGSAACLFFAHHVRGWEGMQRAAKILAGVVFLRITYFDLFLHNPYFDKSQFIGDMPVLHAGTYLYGAVALGCALASRFGLFADNPFLRQAANILGVVCLFMLVSLNVTQFFHGGYVRKGSLEDRELYSYSIAWLLTGLALLAYGIRQSSKTARLASLCFILLTVLKVFLVDASELKDLYRVFSFLGLGASLIGLSFFYSRYVFKREKQAR